MKNTLFVFFAVFSFLLSSLPNESGLFAQTNLSVRGIVFQDKNENGFYDPSQDKPLKGIAVSNGREVVVTNRNGVYELPLRNNSAIFVIKPRNWMVRVDKTQIPRYYYMYSTNGASGKNFDGLHPTGPLPESVNFPLYPHKEPDSFDVLVFGDTQPSNDKEIYYIEQDVLSALSGKDGFFGITLGDVVDNNLNLFDHLIQSISTIGIPWWYVPGNHDNDYTGNNDFEARGAWYRTFGPSYYSFSYGLAHFVVLDNIRMVIEGTRRSYKTGLGEDQMEFLRNEIKRMNSDQLLVLLMHIPYEKSTEWVDEAEKMALYELIASHPNSVSLAGHTHEHYHQFIDKKNGFPGDKPHHLISIGAVCGSWWEGAPDEYGIPHAMMMDGTPNGYAFLHIDGYKWNLRWKAARKSVDFQMYIDAPESISSGNTDSIKVIANIYNALPSAEVKMRIGSEGEWISMKRTLQNDPVRLAAIEREKQLGKVPWLPLRSPTISEHIWVAKQKVKLDPGVYLIQVKAEEEWWGYEGKRLLYVK